MKKILFTIAALAVAFGFTACSNEGEALSNAKNEKATVVAMTEVGTRTALNGDDTNGYDVVWSDNDQITIGSETFTIKTGVGTTTATFEGTAPADGDYIAYYGISTDDVGRPQFGTQHYKAGKVSNFPMYAKTTVKDGKIEPLQFKNFGGILSLTIKGTATIKSIIIKADQYLSGQLVQFDDYYYFNTSNRACQLTLDCGEGIALTSTGTVFNIAMIPYDDTGSITYTGVKITLIDTNNKTYTKTFNGTSGLVIERSKITRASFTAEVADQTTGKAYAKGLNRDVNWVQLRPDGPKFATEKTEKILYEDALKTGDDFVWGANWRMPTSSEMQELVTALNEGSEYISVTVDETNLPNVIATFKGKKEGYTDNTLSLPLRDTSYDYVTGYRYWTKTNDDRNDPFRGNKINNNWKLTRDPVNDTDLPSTYYNVLPVFAK